MANTQKSDKQNQPPILTPSKGEKLQVVSQENDHQETDYKKLYLQEKQKRERLEDNVPLPYIRIDKDGKIIASNSTAQNLNIGQEKFSEKERFTNVFSGFTNTPTLKKKIHEVLAKKTKKICQISHPYSPIVYNIIIKPENDGAGIFMIDVSNEIQYKKKFADAAKFLEAFFYKTSHSLKEPMDTIKNTFNHLNPFIDKKQLDTEDTEILKGLPTSFNKFYDRIKGLCLYSELSKLEIKTESINLKTIIEAKANVLLDTHNITDCELVIKNECKVSTIISDQTLFSNIIDIIIDNTIRFRKHDETMHLHIDIQEATDVNNLIKITFKDKGVGISETQIDHLSGMFYRGHENSNHGLGLFTAKKAIERLGGQFKVKSANKHFSFAISIYIPKNIEHPI